MVAVEEVRVHCGAPHNLDLSTSYLTVTICCSLGYLSLCLSVLCCAIQPFVITVHEQNAIWNEAHAACGAEG